MNGWLGNTLQADTPASTSPNRCRRSCRSPAPRSCRMVRGGTGRMALSQGLSDETQEVLPGDFLPREESSAGAMAGTPAGNPRPKSRLAIHGVRRRGAAHPSFGANGAPLDRRRVAGEGPVGCETCPLWFDRCRPKTNQAACGRIGQRRLYPCWGLLLNLSSARQVAAGVISEITSPLL